MHEAIDEFTKDQRSHNALFVQMLEANLEYLKSSVQEMQTRSAVTSKSGIKSDGAGSRAAPRDKSTKESRIESEDESGSESGDECGPKLHHLPQSRREEDNDHQVCLCSFAS